MKKKDKSGKWYNVPKRDMMSWFSEYLVSSMILKAWDDKKGQPRRVRVPEDCIKENKDGSGTLRFEVDW